MTVKEACGDIFCDYCGVSSSTFVKILKQSEQHLLELIDDGCDHDVGLCNCGIIYTRNRLLYYIKLIEEDNNDN